MRFHVVSLPHTQVTSAFSACAYTQKVRKFCDMMRDRGHVVFLYAGEDCEARVDKHEVCISEADRWAAVAPYNHYTAASFDNSLPHWQTFNSNTAAAINRNLGPRDHVCLIAGRAQKPIADALPLGTSVVEFGIGYSGFFAARKVFESYAWMHSCYSGWKDPADADGEWFDDVIPNFFDLSEFEPSTAHGTNLLFMGRMIDRKGIDVAVRVAEELGVTLQCAGPGTPPPGVEYLGVLDPVLRSKALQDAYALIAPTKYIEPFGGVAVEAMLCGTPAVTTDWGAFTETVLQGFSGFRCRTLQEFVEGVENAKRLDREQIRGYAAATFSLQAIAPRYERYFKRLDTLNGDGWYARNK